MQAPTSRLRWIVGTIVALIAAGGGAAQWAGLFEGPAATREPHPSPVSTPKAFQVVLVNLKGSFPGTKGGAYKRATAKATLKSNGVLRATSTAAEHLGLSGPGGGEGVQERTMSLLAVVDSSTKSLALEVTVEAHHSEQEVSASTASSVLQLSDGHWTAKSSNITVAGDAYDCEPTFEVSVFDADSSSQPVGPAAIQADLARHTDGSGYVSASMMFVLSRLTAAGDLQEIAKQELRIVEDERGAPKTVTLSTDSPSSDLLILEVVAAASDGGRTTSARAISLIEWQSNAWRVLSERAAPRGAYDFRPDVSVTVR